MLSVVWSIEVNTSDGKDDLKKLKVFWKELGRFTSPSAQRVTEFSIIHWGHGMLHSAEDRDLISQWRILGLRHTYSG